MHSKGFSIKALLSLLLIAFTFSAAIIFPAYAKSDSASITLICQRSGKSIEGAQWSAYRIGSRSPYGGFVLEGSFEKYPVTLDAESSSAISAAAYTLENYAILDSIPSDAKGSTDKDGKLTFSGLSEGIYLILGYEFSNDEIRFTPSPSIVELGGVEDSDITVYPKYVTEDIPKPETVTYSVRKTWANDTGEPYARPSGIKVELYADESLYQTVTLDASNGWYYEWKSDKMVSWRVKEKEIPDSYTVSYGVSITEFLIVNTYNPTSPTTEPSTSASSSKTTTTKAAAKTTTTKTTTPVTTAPSPGVTTVTTTLSPREELTRVVEEYENLNEDDYTPESWREFKEALEHAMKVLSAEDSTEEEIRLALIELEQAKSKLVYGYEPWLPQTGQLWWPVPVLAGAGLVLIAVGMRVNFKKGTKNDKKE